MGGCSRPSAPAPILRRFANNPVLAARARHPWESRYVFNAASIHLAGKVHLLYRAIGDEGLSRLGYAASADGIRFDERGDEPVYESRPCPVPVAGVEKAAAPHASGGSWHGCEDPRLTQLADRLYMTYTDFCGWASPPAVAMTSIAVDDFLARNWAWSPARIISPPGEVHKNWVVFPAMFGGRYAILHSLTPDP
ncbi:MAG: hypothetical protein ACLGHG_08855 [Gammaproteobacteria bacterium]